MTESSKVLDYSASAADRALRAFEAQAKPDVAATVEEGAFGQGILAALVRAEQMAAVAGVVPLETSPDGVPGIHVNRVGEAMARIQKAPEPVRTIYLATHAAAWQAMQAAKRKPFELSPNRLVTKGTSRSSEGLGPFVIPLVVVGVVAVAAATYGVVREVRRIVEVRGEYLRQVALAGRAAELQAAGTPPDAPAWDVLRTLAKSPVPSGDSDALVVGVALVGVGGVVWWKRKELARWLGIS